MNELIWQLGVGYLLIFVILTLIKTLDKGLEKVIFCTTCFTWFGMFIISILIGLELEIIALMAGMSITGIAHKLDERFGFQFIWQFVLTMIGITLLTLFP